ncbi:hypothetical protein [Microbacterium rhizophilus]|uniref:hypothetical protein n=1 Tax=Microbacterium rhizophilus TaxID=3138934 RepID=UPI0031ED3BC2
MTRTTALGLVRLAWAEVGAVDRRRDPESDAARTCGFRGERRELGDALLAELIADLAPGAGTAIRRRCLRCGGEDHGAPHPAAAPVVVSVSYAGRLVVAAAARDRDAASLGVDAERGAGPLPGLAPLFAPLAPPDRAGWTRIEAALKADGRGLRVPPGDVRLAHEGPGFLAHVPGRSDPIEVVTIDDGPPGCVVSVARAPR